MLEQTYAYYPGTQALVDQRAMNDPFPTRIPGRVQKRSQQASGPILLLDSGRVKLANRVEACPATTGSTRDAQRSPAGRPAGRPVGGGASRAKDLLLRPRHNELGGHPTA